jgi:hypothetical protein
VQTMKHPLSVSLTQRFCAAQCAPHNTQSQKRCGSSLVPAPSRRRLLNIACGSRPFPRRGLHFFLCSIIHELAMERAILPIHFIPSLIIFAFADCGPFRLAKAITHKVPFLTATPALSRAPAGLLRTLLGGLEERRRFPFQLSQADTGSPRDALRIRPVEFEPRA